MKDHIISRMQLHLSGVEHKDFRQKMYRRAATITKLERSYEVSSIIDSGKAANMHKRLLTKINKLDVIIAREICIKYGLHTSVDSE